MAGPRRWEAAADYIDQVVEIPGPCTDRLCSAARDADIDVAIGMIEREPRTRGSVYSTLLFIGHEGRILSRHHKLKSSANERITWADGDTDGLLAHAGMLRPEDIPERYRDILQQHDKGDSVIIDPRGEIIAGPVSDEETILKAKLSMSLVRRLDSR